MDAFQPKTGKSSGHFQASQHCKGSPMTFMIEASGYLGVTPGPDIMCFGPVA
jgi:hypothetical protein